MRWSPDFLNPIATARRSLLEGDAALALAAIDKFLKSHPDNEEALRLHAEATAELSKQCAAQGASLAKEAEGERDLTRRVALLKEAERICPGDTRLHSLAALAETQHDVLISISARVAVLEESDRRVEAASQFAMLSRIAPGNLDVDKLLESAKEQLRRHNFQEIVIPEAQNAATSPRSVPEVAKTTHKLATWRIWAPVAAGVFAIGLLVLVMVMRRSHAPAVKGGVLAIKVNPTDARVEVDGKLYSGYLLTEGKHRLHVSRDGYRTVQQEIQIPASAPFVVSLTAAALQVSVDTNPPLASYSLDEGPVVPLTDGQAVLPDIPSGTHRLIIRGSGNNPAESVVEFEGQAERPTRVIRITPAGDSASIVAVPGAGKFLLFSSPDGLNVRHESGEAIGTVTAEGLEVPRLPGQGTPILVGNKESEWPIFLNSGPTAGVYIFVRANASTGSVLVRADEPDGMVRIDRQLRSRAKLKGGEYYGFRGLAPGTHEIALTKQGFRVEPPVQQITVVRGKDTRVDFHLVPLSTVQIRGAIPGTRVSVNGADLGAVAADGTAAVEVDAGPCRIELKREKYAPHAMERDCTHAAPVVLAGADTAMVSTVGFIHIPSLQPSNATVTARREGQPPRALSLPRTELPVGVYELRIAAPGFGEATMPNVRVFAGKENELAPITLKRE